MDIIGTTSISFEIENVLKSADKYLILVTPYLKLNQRLKVGLSDAFKRVENVFLLHREHELKKEESLWLNSFDNIKIFPIKNLHSKIYVNEEVAIISSMNLYEYSQINNHEIGVVINEKKDTLEFNKTLNEIRIILESQFEDNDFQKIFENTIDFTMRRLFKKISEKYSFKNYRSGSQQLYEYISDKSRSIIEFDKSELYEDGSAILRSTNLGKHRYELLEKELRKIAN